MGRKETGQARPQARRASAADILLEEVRYWRAFAPNEPTILYRLSPYMLAPGGRQSILL